jgi:hypothetical protein
MDNCQEIWMPILFKEEKTYYEISTNGRISSNYKNKINIRSSHDNCHGYLGITLSHKGEKFSRKIHRLVAEAFIENPQNLPEVNHKNHDKYDNRKENLEWGTKKYNSQEAAKFGKLGRGSRKLPPKPVGKYFAGILLKKYTSLGSASKDGYPRVSIDRAIKSGKNYKGFFWKSIE